MDKLKNAEAICHECAIGNGAKPSEWPVTVGPGTCDVCGKEKAVVSVHDYHWPDGTHEYIWD